MLVRARNGYDVPALLNWLGACNYGITGAEHQAVLRYFHEEHGAELVTLEDQVLELLVTRRPPARPRASPSPRWSTTPTVPTSSTRASATLRTWQHPNSAAQAGASGGTSA
ncbi:hypothetical protein GCM10020256_44000 [Streptomyces thermocoprophilus]